MDMDAKLLLGKRLRKFRKENGYSQNHIANILGVERSTYTYYETGKTVPVIFDLMRLADLYSISLDTLLGFHADSSDPLAFGEPREPVKAAVRRKERYLSEAVQDLSSEERQLLAFYRSAKPAERRQIFDFLRSSRRKEHRRNEE
ncbi:MAG: helix-turn-helix domain-containing protein [Hominenteromicrobium sp.]